MNGMYVKYHVGRAQSLQTPKLVAERGADGVPRLAEPDAAERASRHERPGARQPRGGRHGERGGG